MLKPGIWCLRVRGVLLKMSFPQTCHHLSNSNRQRRPSAHRRIAQRLPKFLIGAVTAKRASALLAVLTAGALTACGASLNDNAQFSTAPTQSNPAMGLAAGSTNNHPNTTGSTVTGSIALDANAKEALKLTAVSDPTSSAYKIGPLDVIEVSVFKVPDLSRTVQVADSGTVNLPLVGEIPAVGRTAQEIERDLTKRLGAKYLQSPQVNVYVKEYNSQRVTVDGSVKKPGVYPIRGDATLLQVIATAEGLTETAQSDVVVFRNVDGKRTAGRFDVNDIRAGNSKDPKIQQGDVIIVSDSAVKSAYQGLLRALPLATLVPLL
jgi:polysaccharide biosynthesis/export protein